MKTLRLKKENCNEIRESDIAVEKIEEIMNWISIRCEGEFERKALSLDCGYDYVLGEDSEGVAILVPLKKCCK